MRLRKFETTVFAGLKDTKVEFEDGINVILGPNEAGKSTLVEAIFATLFRDERQKRNSKIGREFYRRFFPILGGDYIDGYVEFEVDGRVYALKKEWGSSPTAELRGPDGAILKSGNRIAEKLKELFQYGPATFGNVVFARQRDVKQAVERIRSNSEITQTVSSFLRNAVMELDGVAVDELRQKVKDELDELASRWDLNQDRPENPNKDFKNPYKRDVGQILQAYYNLQKARYDWDEARKLENDFAAVGSRVRELEQSREQVAVEIEKLAALEQDINRRAVLEVEIKRLGEKDASLRKINSQWPKLELKLEEGKERRDSLNQTLKELKQKKELVEKAKERDRLATILDKADDLKGDISDIEEKLKELPEVTLDDVKKLESLQRKMDTAQAKMEAGTLLVKFNNVPPALSVIRGIGDREKVEGDQELTAQGYLRIEVEDVLDVEVRSGQIDFETLKDNYETAKKELDELLAQLGVDSISEAKAVAQKRDELEGEIKTKNTQLSQLLDGADYAELKAKAEELAAATGEVPDPDKVADELFEAQKHLAELEAELKRLEETINEWEEEYGDKESILDELVEVKAHKANLNKELEGLAELPEGFVSAEEFTRHLAELRQQKDQLDEELGEKREELWKIEARLPESSSEELAEVVENCERELKRLKLRARSLETIRQTMERIVQEMDEDSFTPLITSFSRHLDRLTMGKYQVGNVDEEFGLEIGWDNGRTFPVDDQILSYGTYDGVALAFRFALLEHLFGDRRGLVILDDCLVNLDPDRRSQAIELIKDFAADCQVIFTTCDPRTASDLGGKVIELTA